VEVFEPHFTYHGFRYVEVTGLPEKPALDDLVGCAFGSSAPTAGRFECSEPLLNKLMENIIWTQRANLMSVPTDCPQRDERLGWMGDILAFAQTACFNMDMAAFFTKWLRDVRDAQTADGRYPDFAPHPFDPAARFSSVPAWGDAGVFVPWRAYVNYGDRRLLEEHLASARRWIEYVHEKNPDLLWKNARGNDYGDWLNADTLKLEGWPKSGAEVPKEVFATMFFAHSTELVAKMAAVLGRSEEARRYAALAEEIKAAFQRAYVAPDGRLQGNTQAGYALALYFDLLPAALRPAAARYMLEAFGTYGGHISTGFHSTIALMQELTRNGFNDEAYRLINNRTMPSWGYALEHGATTIWERWDGYVEGRGFQDPEMNSFSHYALGSVGEWMYRTIAGLNPDEDHPGYKHFVICPRPGGGLTWATGEYDSMYGRIVSRWCWEENDRRDNGEAAARRPFELDVIVPANTTATVFLPARAADTVLEGAHDAERAEGVEFVRQETEERVYIVGAGHYQFRVTRSAE
jgi:alpha-L-rhamnosidase